MAEKKSKVMNIPTNESDKAKYIDEAIKKITDVYGEGSICQDGGQERIQCLPGHQ